MLAVVKVQYYEDVLTYTQQNGDGLLRKPLIKGMNMVQLAALVPVKGAS